MPGCVLRAAGASFDVDAFLASSTLTPCRVWRAGETRRRSKPGTSPHFSTDSGLVLDVSTESGERLEPQVEDAISFLKAHDVELQRLAACPGVDSIGLDFGLVSRDVAAQFDRFPSSLVHLAAQFNMYLELSQYHAFGVTRGDEP